MRKLKTKIICTIGPTSKSLKILKSLIKNGADALRINLSHTPFEKTIEIVKNTRSISKKIEIILDNQGKETRIGPVSGPVELRKNQKIIISSVESAQRHSADLYITRPEIIEAIRKGEIINIDDFNLKLKIIRKTKHILECMVERGGQISSPKNINVDKKIELANPLTELDKKLLKECKKFGISEFALSYVDDAEDVKIAKRFIPKNIKITSKIETLKSIKNLEEIAKLSDNISIDRNDLGTEIGYQKIPIIQKFIIKKCQNLNKPVFVATHILESMINKDKPTRGEVNDIMNTVFDGASALVLSSETSIGKDPVKILKTLRKIVAEAEFVLGGQENQGLNKVIERLEELHYV